MKAVWNGAVIAQSDNTVVVEGNHYFPHDSIKAEHFEPSDHTTFCSWKGTAGYYDVVVDGQTNAAAWVYADPMDAASEIENRIAFWRDVEVVEA